MTSSYKLFTFEDDGTIPNNPNFPVVFYPGVFKHHSHEIESIFNLNNWRNSWINGVYDYHHFHSNAHEVLGVRSGSAILTIGGVQGETIEVKTGDVLVLPAGTGHMNVKSSNDFKIVGAYPNGDEYNVMTGKTSERLQALKDIPLVTSPSSDPVYGNRGQVLNHWIIKA